MWNPSEKQAKEAFDYGNDPNPDNYNSMNEIGKRAFWQYGKSKGIFNINTLGPKSKAEYLKYVTDDIPYASDDPMERATLARRSEQGQFNVSEQVKTGKVQDRRLLNAQRLEGLTPTPTPIKPQLSRNQPIQRNERAGTFDKNKPVFDPVKATGGLALDTLSTINSVLQTPATVGKYGVEGMNQAKAENKNPIGGLLKGYATGLGKAITNQDAVENTEVLEGVAPKTTAAIKQKFPNAYKAASTIANLIGVDDLTGWGLLGDIAKARKLSEGMNTTADLARMSQAGIKNAEKVAKIMQENPDIVKAVDNLDTAELDEYFAYIDYMDEVNRKTPEYIKSEARMNVPKAKEIKTLTKTLSQKPNAYLDDYLDTIGDAEEQWMKQKQVSEVPVENVVNKVNTVRDKGTSPKYYRYTKKDNPMSNWGHAMFADDIKKINPDGIPSTSDGLHYWTLDAKDAIDIKKLKSKIIKAWEYDRKHGFTGDFAGNTISDDAYYKMTGEEVFESFNPKDIVDFADGYDGEVNQWLWERIIEPNNIKAVKTSDGAVVFNNDDGIIKNMFDTQRKFTPSTTTQKGTQQAQTLNPLTPLKLEGKLQPPALKGQTLKPNKPILSALDARVNKPYDAPISKAVETPIKPISEVKPLSNINTLPIENKSLKGALKPPKETDKIKQAHSNIRNLKNQLDVASNLDEITALKKTLATERKTVKEYNTAIRDERVKKVKDLIFNSDNWKDKGGYTGTLRLQRETWDRNIIDIAGKDGEAVKKAIFTPIHANEAARTRFKNISRNTVKNLNLSAQEREIVQKVGEGVMPLTDIPKGMDASKIQKSIDTLRTWYDEAIDKANDVLVRNGYEPIGKLPNYFPHFTGDDPVLKALGIKLDNVELPTDINGITATFRPGKQFFGNFLKRTGDKTTYDAVAGFDRYVEGISNVIYHTDDIKTLRTFVDELRLKSTSDEVMERVNKIRDSELMDEAEKEELISKLLNGGNTHLSNSVADLEEYTNVLAGKKDLADRAAERWFGRKIYNGVNVISNRIGRNMTAISPSSWLTNFIPITQSLATTSKKAVAQAFYDTVKNLVKNDGFIDKSDFLTNRVGSDILDKGAVDKAGDVLSAPFKWIDTFTSNVVTRAKYLEGIEKGLSPEDAMKQADEWGAKILGDRSKGAQPTLFNQRNPITRVLTQFQLEVNNQVSFIMKDMPREYLKDGANPESITRLGSALGQLAIYSWLYNEMYEKATGRRPAADVIGIALDLKKDMQNPNLKKSQAGINLAQNVAETLPFSSTFTGGRIPIGTPLASFGKGIKGVYDVAAGDKDPKTGLTQAGKDLAKGAAYIVPPFGGSQLIKTAEGLSAVNKGGVYKTNAAGEKALQYPIEKTTKNKVQAWIFGKSALGETRVFYDNKVKALGADQTKAYEYAVNEGIQPKVVYNQILALRKLMPDKTHKGVTDAQKINSISTNQNLSYTQKQLLIKLFIKTEEGKKLLEKSK